MARVHNENTTNAKNCLISLRQKYTQTNHLKYSTPSLSHREAIYAVASDKNTSKRRSRNNKNFPKIQNRQSSLD